MGGLELIAEWTAQVEHPRLVIIDTLAMVRPPNRRDKSTYDADYAAVVSLRDLASAKGIAIVLVHHSRKAEADDALDTISGTLGLTGAPDTIIVVKRDTEGKYELHGRGRDLEEIAKAAEFDGETCRWRLLGDIYETKMNAQRLSIVEALKSAPEAMTPTDLAGETGIKSTNLRKVLGRMVKDGVVKKVSRGRYEHTQVSGSQRHFSEPVDEN